MKMKFGGFVLAALLLVSFVPFGYGGHVFADSHNIPPLLVTADLDLYTDFDTVNLSGSIRDYDPDVDSGKAVTIQIVSPNNQRVGFGQVTPNADGLFSYSFIAGGPIWKIDGEYSIISNFDAQSATTMIVYASSDAPPVPPPPPPPPVCGPNQELVGDTCMDMPPPPPPPVCGPNQELVGDTCMDMPPPPPPPVCGPNQELVGDTCMDMPPTIVCGQGTQLVDGTCVLIPDEPVETPADERSGCLIATAAYGSELAPQVQFLREIRDNTVLSTSSGVAFMAGFNQLYYSFSPTIADMERESPLFKEAVRAFITPMISTLSIMTLADSNSELDVLGLGISVIMLNLGLYIVAPALVGFKAYGRLKSRRQ